MPEKYLFIARAASGREVLSVELPVTACLYYHAREVMHNAEIVSPESTVEYCEVWTKTDPHTMKKVITVF